jgi:hypothetical protein
MKRKKKKVNYSFLLDERNNANSYVESLFTMSPTKFTKDINMKWKDWLTNFDKETFNNAYLITEKKRLDYVRKNVILRENFLPRDENYKTEVINAINDYLTTRKFEFVQNFSKFTNININKLEKFIFSLNRPYVKFDDMLPLFDDSYFGQFYNDYMEMI